MYHFIALCVESANFPTFAMASTVSRKSYNHKEDQVGLSKIL